jgi:hypothetical protein
MTTWNWIQLMWWSIRDELILEYLKPFTLLYRKVTNG